MCWDVEREWRDYTKWLLNRVGFVGSGYDRLLNYLNTYPFHAVLPRDECRIDDGVMLRDEYCSERGVPIYLFDSEECTVLEILVSLSILMDSEWIGEPGDPNPCGIFWEMLQNLELNRFTNSRFDISLVDEILRKWINREFEKDGKGSIFPIYNPIRDQRKAEIWQQMQEYINENY